MIFNLQHASVLKAHPRQHISNIYIYLYVSYQSVYIGSKSKASASSIYRKKEMLQYFIPQAPTLALTSSRKDVKQLVYFQILQNADIFFTQ